LNFFDGEQADGTLDLSTRASWRLKGILEILNLERSVSRHFFAPYACNNAQRLNGLNRLAIE